MPIFSFLPMAYEDAVYELRLRELVSAPVCKRLLPLTAPISAVVSSPEPSVFAGDRALLTPPESLLAAVNLQIQDVILPPIQPSSLLARDSEWRAELSWHLLCSGPGSTVTCSGNAVRARLLAGGAASSRVGFGL